MIAVNEFASGCEAAMVTTGSVTPLLELPLDEIRAICRRHSVRELAIFGSALREDFGPDSDVDLLVEFELNSRVGFIEFGLMEQEFEAAIGRRIDLVSKRALRPELKDRILASARALYVSG